MPVHLNTKGQQHPVTLTTTGFSVSEKNVEIGRREMLQWVRQNADRDTLGMFQMAISERLDILDNDLPIQLSIIGELPNTTLMGDIVEAYTKW